MRIMISYAKAKRMTGLLFTERYFSGDNLNFSSCPFLSKYPSITAGKEEIVASANHNLINTIYCMSYQRGHINCI